MVVLCLVLMVVDDLWPREGAGAHGHPLHPMMTMEDEGMLRMSMLLLKDLLENGG